MFLRQVFLAVVGASFGLMAAGGVFTVLISVGLIPRFAGKLHINKKVFLFEEAVIVGTLFGNYLSVFDRYAQIGTMVRQAGIFGVNTDKIWNIITIVLCILFGLFAGIFVGCLALAIAEMLDTIPIFARRMNFRRGLGVVILAVALGKAAGSLIYFANELFLHGGV